MRSFLLSTILCISVVATPVVAGELPDFTELVEEVGPAVVNISTTQKVKQRHGLPPGMEMPELPENSPWDHLHLQRIF